MQQIGVEVGQLLGEGLNEDVDDLGRSAPHLPTRVLIVKVVFVIIHTIVEEVIVVEISLERLLRHSHLHRVSVAVQSGKRKENNNNKNEGKKKQKVLLNLVK